MSSLMILAALKRGFWDTVRKKNRQTDKRRGKPYPRDHRRRG